MKRFLSMIIILISLLYCSIVFGQRIKFPLDFCWPIDLPPAEELTFACNNNSDCAENYYCDPNEKICKKEILLPNLAGGRMEIVGPELITWGATIQVHYMIANKGDYEINNAIIAQQFYLSKTGSWQWENNYEDITIGTFLHENLSIQANSESSTFVVSLHLPESPPERFRTVGHGPYFLGMKTDAYNAVAETHENDNGPGYYGRREDWDRFVIPHIFIRDAKVMEGNAGNTRLKFMIECTDTRNNEKWLFYKTRNGTAEGGIDYNSVEWRSKKICENNQIIDYLTISVIGDQLLEDHEDFYVDFQPAIGSYLANRSVRGTILNDDGYLLRITDAMVMEPVSDSSNIEAQFQLAFDPKDSIENILVHYFTVEGSAKENVDYIGVNESRNFSPNLTNKVNIKILPDRKSNEGLEKFYLKIRCDDPRVLVLKDKGYGIIIDSDFPSIFGR